MTNNEAFRLGYLDKEANIFGDLVGTGASKGAELGFDLSKLLAIGGPAILGAGAGHLLSSATSPTKTDEATLQRQLHAMELQEFEAELRRRKAIEEKVKKEKGADVAPRSLRL
jgi:hypothetical protein